MGVGDTHSRARGLFKNRHAVARSAFPQPFIEPGAVNHVRLDLVRTEEYALARGAYEVEILYR